MRTLVDDEFRLLVLTPDARKLSGPDVLGVGQHDAHESEEILLLRRRLIFHLAHVSAATTHQRGRVDEAHLPGDDADGGQHEQALYAEHSQDHVDDRAQPGTACNPATTCIRDIRAGATAFPLHSFSWLWADAAGPHAPVWASRDVSTCYLISVLPAATRGQDVSSSGTGKPSDFHALARPGLTR